MNEKTDAPKTSTKSSILSSLKRGFRRIVVISGISALLLGLSHAFPMILGSTLAPMFFGFGLAFAGMAVGDIALRILQPKIDPQLAATEAIESNNVGAGLVYLGRMIFAAVILMLVVTASRAAVHRVDLTQPPKAAIPLIPILKAQQKEYWNTLTLVSALGAQVEQETCISLTSKGCWNPNAQLKTSREQGIGLGQITRAFNSNGSTRFDSLADLKKAYPRQLVEWSWDRPYDPTLQLRALVLKDKQGYTFIQDTASESDRLAMSFAAYNGGSGGLNSDRRACAGTKGCDTSKWFGNVALTSLKAKTAVHGYGQSFFEINRGYVQNIMVDRRKRYLSLDAPDVAIAVTEQEHTKVDIVTLVAVVAPLEKQSLTQRMFGF